MKKLITISFCIAQSLLSFGQYFNKSIEANPDALGTYNIERIGIDSIIIFPAGIVNNTLYIHSTIINNQGDTIINKNYLKPPQTLFTGWANSTNPTNDGGFIMGGGLQDTSTYGHLIKYSRLGDTLWTKTFGDTANFYTLRQAIQVADGGYLAIGESNQRHGTYSDGWLLKTDSAGNKEWERFYGLLSQTERLTSVYSTTDGGYILGGGRRHYAGSPPRNNFDPMIIKVDSMGVEEWTYIYDTPLDDAIAYAIQTMDGNYVFSSSISYPPPPTMSNPARATLFKVSNSGNLMWTKSFGFASSNHSFQLVKELPDSSLIAVGRRREATSGLIKGLMVKTDVNGDSIFVQTYENDPNGIDNQNYLWDVIPMDDGGFMAAGEVIGIPPSVPFRQDAWVIRVDSMGCIISNCLVGVDENLDFRVKTLEVYPNPTQGQINLESTKELQSIEVYNLQGQKVQEINPKERNWELPEQSGLYLIRIQDEEGRVYTEKIIKN